MEFITIQNVARTDRADPLLLLGWNSPKYVHTTGILPPTLQFWIKIVQEISLDWPNTTQKTEYEKKIEVLAETWYYACSSIDDPVEGNWWKLFMLKPALTHIAFIRTTLRPILLSANDPHMYPPEITKIKRTSIDPIQFTTYHHSDKQNRRQPSFSGRR